MFLSRVIGRFLSSLPFLSSLSSGDFRHHARLLTECLHTPISIRAPPCVEPWHISLELPSIPGSVLPVLDLENCDNALVAASCAAQVPAPSPRFLSMSHALLALSDNS